MTPRTPGLPPTLGVQAQGDLASSSRPAGWRGHFLAHWRLLSCPPPHLPLGLGSPEEYKTMPTSQVPGAQSSLSLPRDKRGAWPLGPASPDLPPRSALAAPGHTAQRRALGHGGWASAREASLAAGPLQAWLALGVQQLLSRQSFPRHFSCCVSAPALTSMALVRPRGAEGTPRAGNVVLRTVSYWYPHLKPVPSVAGAGDAPSVGCKRGVC